MCAVLCSIVYCMRLVMNAVLCSIVYCMRTWWDGFGNDVVFVQCLQSNELFGATKGRKRGDGVGYIGPRQLHWGRGGL